MAIDSARKRASALYFSSHRHGKLLPDGAISGADRADAVGFYRGITGLLFTVTLESVSVPQPVVTPSTPQPGVSCSVPQPTTTQTVKNRIG